MDKICNFCGNKNFRNTQARYIYRHDDKYLIVENVPCEECEYCGEQYFAARSLKAIEADFFSIHNSGKPPRKRIEVPVEEFLDLEIAGNA